MSKVYDTVIIGAGLTGLEVASVLARRGIGQVAVVEAGNMGAGSPADGTVAGAGVRQLMETMDLEGDLPRWRPWTNESGPHYSGATGLRRRVGGRSLCWHGVVVRMDSWELTESDAWPSTVRQELMGSADRADRGLYDLVEEDLRAWAGAPLDGIRTPSEDYLCEWARSLGYGGAQPAPLAARRPTQPRSVEWQAYSPPYAWQEETTQGLPLPDILTDREVVAVHVTHGRVSGVEIRHRGQGHAETIPCGRVVLAAGTIENTRLVAQATGYGSGATDSFTGLNDHIVQGFAVTIPVRTWGHEHLQDGGCLMLRGDASTRSNVFFKLRSTSSPEFVTLDVWMMGEQERSDLNKVSFVNTASFPWKATVRTGLSAEDWQVVRKEQETLLDIWSRTAKALDLPEETMEFSDFLSNLQPIDRAYDLAATRPGRPVPFAALLGSLDHEAGTLPLGSVLEATGQVPGCDGLYVTGPSVFSRSGAANPSLTSLALARRLATFLAEQ